MSQSQEEHEWEAMYERHEEIVGLLKEILKELRTIRMNTDPVEE